MIATNKDFVECVEYLLEAGANANIPTNNVSSKLFFIAILILFFECVYALLLGGLLLLLL